MSAHHPAAYPGERALLTAERIRDLLDRQTWDWPVAASYVEGVADALDAMLAELERVLPPPVPYGTTQQAHQVAKFLNVYRRPQV